MDNLTNYQGEDMLKLKIGATIPTVQYGNIMPEIELEGESLDFLHDRAMTYIQKVWDEYGERPLVNKTLVEEEGNFVKITTFTNEVVLFDAFSHTYKDEAGNILMSGSRFKKQFDKPFPIDMMVPKVATKYKVTEDQVRNMWSGNSLISRTFGDAIHFAMEQYFRFKGCACGDKEYNLPKHPILRQAVLSFPDLKEDIIPELVVSDVAKKRVGMIDGMIILDEKVCRLIDYKSDAEIEKNLDGHFIQLSFYAHILMAHGWTVDGLTIYNYTDKWQEYERGVVDIDKLEIKK